MMTHVLKMPAVLPDASRVADNAVAIMCEDWDSLKEIIKRQLNISVEIEPLSNWEDFQHAQDISESLQSSLDGISAGISNATRRVSRIAGQIAAERACRSHFPQFDGAQPEICRQVSGKPIVKNLSNAHVSISHSAAFAVACAGAMPIGIDVEKIERRPECLVRYFFSRKEKDWLMNQAKAPADAVTILWTRKEAISKLLGKGGHLAFKNIAVLDNECTYCVYSYIVDAYAVTIAYTSEGTTP